MKGVSAIIAMVLVVLITVALTGTFLIWTQRTAGELSERGTEQSQRFTGQFDKGVRIESADCTQAAGSDFIYVRNTGTVNWGGAELNYFINGTLNSSIPTFDNNGLIARDGIVKVTFGTNDNLQKDYIVRVVYQEVSDSVVCK